MGEGSSVVVTTAAGSTVEVDLERALFRWLQDTFDGVRNEQHVREATRWDGISAGLMEAGEFAKAEAAANHAELHSGKFGPLELPCEEPSYPEAEAAFAERGTEHLDRDEFDALMERARNRQGVFDWIMSDGSTAGDEDRATPVADSAFRNADELKVPNVSAEQALKLRRMVAFKEGYR